MDRVITRLHYIQSYWANSKFAFELVETGFGLVIFWYEYIEKQEVYLHSALWFRKFYV